MKPITRRKFMTTATLATGFALAVQLISGATLKTDSEGLVTGAIDIPVKDGTIPAYRSAPATGSNFPIVLVLQEIFGVHEHIQDITRRFAKLGYLALPSAQRS